MKKIVLILVAVIAFSFVVKGQNVQQIQIINNNQPVKVIPVEVVKYQTVYVYPESHNLGNVEFFMVMRKTTDNDYWIILDYYVYNKNKFNVDIDFEVNFFYDVLNYQTTCALVKPGEKRCIASMQIGYRQTSYPDKYVIYKGHSNIERPHSYEEFMQKVNDMANCNMTKLRLFVTKWTGN